VGRAGSPGAGSLNGIVAAMLTVVAAWNPFAVPGRSPADDPTPRPRMLGLAIGAGTAALVAAFTDPILSLLSVSVPTLRTAAGAVVGLFGARWAVGPAPRPVEGENATLLTAITVLSPPTVFAALAVTAHDGWMLAAIAIAVAFAAATTVLWRGPSGRVADVLRRSTGGIAVAVGVAMIFAGIRAV